MPGAWATVTVVAEVQRSKTGARRPGGILRTDKGNC